MSGPTFYTVTVVGEMGPALLREFEDFDVEVANSVTRIRFVVADPSVLHGLLHRIEVLGLELLDVHPAQNPPAP